MGGCRRGIISNADYNTGDQWDCCALIVVPSVTVLFATLVTNTVTTLRQRQIVHSNIIEYGGQ
jgi:hypothetical protein